MKKIGLAVASLIFTMSAFAQNPQLKNAKRGDLINSPNLTPYVGIWVWQEGNKTIKLRLKDTISYVGNLELGVKSIKGSYQYIVEGTIKYTSPNSKSPDLIGSEIENNKLKIFINDGISKKQGVGTLYLVNDHTLKMKFVEKKSEFKIPEAKDFTIPQNIVLSKISL